MNADAPTPWSDLGRPPLRPPALRRALEPDGWRVEVLEQVGSTNAVVAERAAAGEPAGLVVVAEAQTHGRGRLSRAWTSPPRAGLTFSVLLRPALPAARWGWLPLWGGLAVAEALRDRAGVDAVVKWPNDVLIGPDKVCGLLAEAADGAVVLGVGLNVSTSRDELPADRPATSLLLAGASTTDRDTLLRAVLRSLTRTLEAADADAYRERCSTVGQRVRVELPTGAVEGTATGIDDDGRIVVDGTPYAAGDVVHLRPAGQPG